MSIETTLTLALASVIFVTGLVLRFFVVGLYRMWRRARGEEAPALYPNRPGSRVAHGIGSGFATVGRGSAAAGRTLATGTKRVVRGFIPLMEYFVASIAAVVVAFWGNVIVPLWRNVIVPFWNKGVVPSTRQAETLVGQRVFHGEGVENRARAGQQISPLLNDGLAAHHYGHGNGHPKPHPAHRRRVVNISQAALEARSDAGAYEESVDV